jgi:hypothetical protein
MNETPTTKFINQEEMTKMTKKMILQKLDLLNSLNLKLNRNYVPDIVMNNLNQSIKDLQVNFDFDLKFQRRFW